MPFSMKVQPIDAKGAVAFALRGDSSRPAAKSRLKRLFERQVPSVLRPNLVEKQAAAGDREKEREHFGGGEPNSVYLDTMVIGFIEEGNCEKLPRGRCICFNANIDDISDEDFDARDSNAANDATEAIKVLVPCVSVEERNLLADASGIMEKTNSCSNKHVCRRLVVEGLRSLAHNAAICSSRWDTTPSFPAGEYEYIDVATDGGHRLLVDVDFRSEFEVARPTKSYRAVLQQLPSVFVGHSDRLQRIVALAAEASRQSMKKKGLHVPPWRRPEYLKAKWFSPYQRTTPMEDAAKDELVSGAGKISCCSGIIPRSISGINFSSEVKDCRVEEAADGSTCGAATAEEDSIKVVAMPWKPLPARPIDGVNVVASLALVL